MKLDHVLAAAFVTTIVGLGAWSWYYGSIFPIAPAPAPSASTPPPLSTPSVLIKVNPPPVLEPSEDNPKLFELLDRCRVSGGVPVVGYGFRVVCLKPASADWWDDPQLMEGKRP